MKFTISFIAALLLSFSVYAEDFKPFQSQPKFLCEKYEDIEEVAMIHMTEGVDAAGVAFSEVLKENKCIHNPGYVVTIDGVAFEATTNDGFRIIIFSMMEGGYTVHVENISPEV